MSIIYHPISIIYHHIAIIYHHISIIYHQYLSFTTISQLITHHNFITKPLHSISYFTPELVFKPWSKVVDISFTMYYTFIWEENFLWICVYTCRVLNLLRSHSFKQQENNIAGDKFLSWINGCKNSSTNMTSECYIGRL